MEQGQVSGAGPTDQELERAIASVPGVADAAVSRTPGSGRSRLRIRLAADEDAEAVSWAVAATLRERFGIPLDPDAIRPLQAAPSEHDEAAPDEPEPDPDRDQIHVVHEQEPAAEAQQDALRDTSQDIAEVASAASVAAAEGALSAGSAARELGATRDRLSAAARAALAGMHGETRGGGLRLDPGRPEQPSDALFGSPQRTGADQPDGAPDTGDDTLGARATDDEQPTGPVPDTGGRPASEGATTEASEPAEADTVIETALPSRAEVQGRAPRAAIRHLDTQRDEQDVRVTATLEHRGRAALGSAVTVPTSQGVLRAVAEATVAALRELATGELLVGIDRITLHPAGDPATASVIVTLLTSRGEETLLGSSIVRSDPEQAVMRATLDALNRRLIPMFAGPPDESPDALAEA